MSSLRRTVAIVDYGMGNLGSVSRAVEYAAADSDFNVIITAEPKDVFQAERVVLPGQGAMPDCMRQLRESGMVEAVLHAAAHKPLMGVCVGMQMLLSSSDEGPSDGLDLFTGKVLRFKLEGRLQPDASRYKVPHMGWNRVIQSRPHPVWAGIPDQAFFYFVHSFYAQPSDPHHSVGESDYGGRFTCALARDNIFSTQFHPEKSAAQGLALYRNFLHWNP